MEKETTGTVISAVRQWWLKINRRVGRLHGMDGAEFPYLVSVRYAVDGKTYTCRQFVGAGGYVPGVGSAVRVLYRADKPSRARLAL